MVQATVQTDSVPPRSAPPQVAPIQASKAWILESFQRILAERQINSSIETKAEEAEQLKNRAALETASQYTADEIVRGLADLQLQFGSVVGGLSEQLSTENNRLGELQRAIAHQSHRLETLRKMRVVADAIHIRTQEHRAQLQRMEEEFEGDRESLEREQTQIRQVWEQERADWTEQQEVLAQRTAAERERQVADYLYENERAQRVALDEYDTERRRQERAIVLEQEQRQKDWAEREAELAARQTDLETYRAQVEAEPEALEAAVREAREEGIREVTRQSRVRAELLEKEWEGAQQGYELQITALEQKLERQVEQIATLSEQLQAAMAQAQSLALRAFETSSDRIAQA